jgi:Xaa-Pro aminopeptidase
MEELGVDALLLSHGADLPWLIGYRAMPLERLTMLVLPANGDAVLVVPALEAPRVAGADDLFGLLAWTDVQDPIDLVASALGAAGGTAGGAPRFAVSDRAWATTVLALQRRLSGVDWIEASVVTSPIRAVKDHAELDALRSAGAAAGPSPRSPATSGPYSSRRAISRSTSPSSAAGPMPPAPTTIRPVG